jgi:hypothetical protein
MGYGRRSQPGIELNKKLLLGGAMLVGVGGVLGAAGVLLGTTAFVSATRHWIRRFDKGPADAARQKWDQARAATLAGARAWQGNGEA